MEYPLKSKKGNVKDKRIIGIYIYLREKERERNIKRPNKMKEVHKKGELKKFNKLGNLYANK